MTNPNRTYYENGQIKSEHWYTDGTIHRDGDMCKKLGFEFIENSLPNFKYTKNYKTVYNRIQPQNMFNNDYDILWDCGNSVWILEF